MHALSFHQISLKWLMFLYCRFFYFGLRFTRPSFENETEEIETKSSYFSECKIGTIHIAPFFLFEYLILWVFSFVYLCYFYLAREEYTLSAKVYFFQEQKAKGSNSSTWGVWLDSIGMGFRVSCASSLRGWQSSKVAICKKWLQNHLHWPMVAKQMVR